MKQTTTALLGLPLSHRADVRCHRICPLLRSLLALVQRLCVLVAETYLQYHRLLSETYNFLGRIKTPHDAAACLLEVGPEFGETEADSFFLRRCTDARISGIEVCRPNGPMPPRLMRRYFLRAGERDKSGLSANSNSGDSYNAIRGRGACWLPFYPKGYLALKNKLFNLITIL